MIIKQKCAKCNSSLVGHEVRAIVPSIYVPVGTPSLLLRVTCTQCGTDFGCYKFRGAIRVLCPWKPPRAVVRGNCYGSSIPGSYYVSVRRDDEDVTSISLVGGKSYEVYVESRDVWYSYMY